MPIRVLSGAPVSASQRQAAIQAQDDTGVQRDCARFWELVPLAKCGKLDPRLDPARSREFKWLAERLGVPAPFPVALPQRAIQLLTYTGDVVCDPFMGSGSTAVAAIRNGRHYVGYDIIPEYVGLTERRVALARAGLPDRIAKAKA